MPDIFDRSAPVAPDADPPEEPRYAEPDGNNGTTEPVAGFPHTEEIRDVNEYSRVMRDEPASDNPFKAFLAKPEHVFFDSQHSEEKVLLLLRRHPITQAGWILVVIVMMILPFLFDAVGLFAFFPGRFQFAAHIGWYLIVMGYALESSLTWFYNVYIVTDERVIDVDFYNLLLKRISAAKIDNIEDVTSVASGVVASVFNFGTVNIQTAGSEVEFDFEDVPEPAKVTAFLNEMIVEEEREKIENRAN